MVRKDASRTKVKTKTNKKRKIANGGQAVANFAKLINSKRLESNLRIYEAKRPMALAELQEIRSENPKAGPAAIQEILDSRLRSVEETKGGYSTNFSAAASIYFLVSMELRQFKPDKDDTRQLWLSLMFLLDSRFYRVANRVARVVIWAIKTYVAAKASKAIAGAAAGKGAAKVVANVVAKPKLSENAAKVVKETFLPVAVKLTKDQIRNAKFANLIIKRSHKELGPVPSIWPKAASQANKSKTLSKSKK